MGCGGGGNDGGIVGGLVHICNGGDFDNDDGDYDGDYGNGSTQPY